jgi:hypothetical protein
MRTLDDISACPNKKNVAAEGHSPIHLLSFTIKSENSPLTSKIWKSYFLAVVLTSLTTASETPGYSSISETKALLNQSKSRLLQMHPLLIQLSQISKIRSSSRPTFPKSLTSADLTSSIAISDLPSGITFYNHPANHDTPVWLVHRSAPAKCNQCRKILADQSRAQDAGLKPTLLLRHRLTKPRSSG